MAKRDPEKVAKNKALKEARDALKKQQEALKKAKEAAAIRQALKSVVTTPVVFSARFSTTTFDRDSGLPLERFTPPPKNDNANSSVKSVITDYVNTSQPAGALFTEAQLEHLKAGDYLLLVGQIQSPAEPWQAKTYPLGSKVLYLGETYYSASSTTGTAPPIRTVVSVDANGSWAYQREENPDWVLIGKEQSLTAPGRRITNPDFGFVDKSFQTGTQGDTWLVTATPGSTEIIFWDSDLSNVLAPDTTYVIGHVENSPSYISGEQLPSNIRLFPPGTTFQTPKDSVKNINKFNASQPCIAPRSLRTASGYTSTGIITQIYVNSMPFFDGGALSMGGGNGIYQYMSPDHPLTRLNAFDGASNAPTSYEFLLVNEYNPSLSVEERVNRPWISDDRGNWSLAIPGMFVGKSYGAVDIPSVNWRGKDSIVGRQPLEWQPSVTYYPRDRVKFSGLEYSFDIVNASGLPNVSPADSNYWSQVDPTGASVSTSISGYRINTITVPEFEMESRLFSLAVPEKSVKISSLPLPIGKISFDIDGEFSLDYANSFTTPPTTYSTRVYNTSYPVNFTLSRAGLEVLRVHWDFGDGNTLSSDSLTASHRYKTSSLNTVQLQVSVRVVSVDGKTYRTSRRINLRKTDVGVVGLPIVVG